MDELGELILGQKPSKASSVADRSSVIAPKKSSMFGRNPQLQAEEEAPDELGQLILGGSSTQQPQQEQPNALQRFGQGVASLADVTVGGVLPLVGHVAQATVRPITTPQKAEEFGQQLSSFFSQPFGKAFGVTETPGYKGEASQQLMNFIGQNVSKGADWIAQKTGLPVQDVNNMLGTLGIAGGAAVAKPLAGATQKVGQAAFNLEQSFADKVKSVTPKVSIETQRTAMQPAGAAATTNKATLDAAIAQASPELAAQLSKENPATISPEVLQRYLDADEVGVRLLKGQATQDPNLISFERNSRSQDPRLVEALSQQNKALQEKVSNVKEAAAPDVFAPDYVANAEGALEYISNKVKQNETATGDAYKALDEFGAGKIEIDSKTLADNALKALSEKEDIDFLPPVMEKRILDLQKGKPMNFDQLNNFTTQISRETRKAQKAGDGNTVHALTILRGEVEKLPLIGETAEAKPLADKARATAKAEFDLLNKNSPSYNKVYADYVNGATDTKDFIQSAVLRSKNKDFSRTMELFDDPIAKQHLRAGALDIIIKDATDASGNFKPARFSKAIENLDVNKKLDVLFGEEAQTLRKIAKTGQLIEARPAGAYVNESNTAGALVAQYGKKLAEQTPIVGRFVEPARQLLQERASKKAVEESLRPGAGVKLKNIGKEK